jgi:hypothetical protein
MKRISLFISIIIFSKISVGQTTSMEILNTVPQPPSNLCEATMEQKKQFLDEVARFDSIFRAKMDEDQQGNEQFHEQNKDEETVNALIKAGYSREDAEKMKNLENMSEEEQEALANQVMMNQYNMTMGEAKKVADYDTASQRRWLKAQSTMMMADAQYDSEKNTKKQLEIKSDLELQQEIKWLQDKLRAGENKYLEKIRQIDIDADSAKAELDPKIENLYKDLNDGGGNSQQVIEKIVSLRRIYCQTFTPDYLETVEGYKGYIVEHIQEYNRLEELQLKLTENQGMLRDPNYKPGKLTMGRVGGYSGMVAAAYKYNLNADWGAQFIGY